MYKITASLKRQFEVILNSKVNAISPYKGYLKVRTNFKDWFAKKSLHIKWWFSVYTELKKRGFRNILDHKTDYKEWVLTPIINGRSCNYSNSTEVFEVISILADFHCKGFRLKTLPKKKMFFPLYMKLYNRLKDFYFLLQDLDSLQDSELKKILSSSGRDFYLDGFSCLEELQNLPFILLNKLAYANHSLCHRDLASHNWIIDKKNKIWLIDFDSADYDLQVGDLWQISMRIFCKNSWDEKKLLTILAIYNKYRRLSFLEEKIIFILYRFPNEFYREALGIAKRKKGYKSEISLPYLKKMAENRTKYMRSLKGLLY